MKTIDIRKIVKISFIVVFAILFLFLAFVIYSYIHGYTVEKMSADLEEYDSYLDNCYYSRNYMPSLDECGDYREALMTAKIHESMFSHDSVALFLQYDEEGYRAACEAIAERYRFFPEPTKLFRDVSGEVWGYSARAVDLGPLSDVNFVLIIGLREEEHSIVYGYFYDSELDYVDDFVSLIKEYFYFPEPYRFEE